MDHIFPSVYGGDKLGRDFLMKLLLVSVIVLVIAITVSVSVVTIRNIKQMPFSQRLTYLGASDDVVPTHGMYINADSLAEQAQRATNEIHDAPGVKQGFSDFEKDLMEKQRRGQA